MEIALLNDSFPPVIDGVANTAFNYAQILTGMGDNITVATPKYPKTADNYDFDVIRYQSINTTRFIGYRAGMPAFPTIKKITEKKPDIIHTHCPVASTTLARMVRETTDAPIVFTYHTKFDVDIANAIKYRLIQEKALSYLCANIKACDEVWVVSNGAGESLQKMGYTGDYVVMPNGVDLPKGIASDDITASLQKKHGIEDGQTVLLFVGRLMWYKGLRLLIDSLCSLKAAGKSFKMIFIGDSSEREEIEEYTRTVNIDDCCVFTGAVRDRELLRGYFTLSDLFMFPSTYDTNGLVVREAAACATASLLISGSCAAEGVNDGVDGLLAAETAADIAARLLPVIDDRTFLRKLGQNAQDNLYLSWEDSVKNARSRYETVIENYKRGYSTHENVMSDDFFTIIGGISAAVQKVNRLVNACESATVTLENRLIKKIKK